MRMSIRFPLVTALAMAALLVVRSEPALSQQVAGSATAPAGSSVPATGAGGNGADAVVPPVKRVQPVTPPPPKPAAKPKAAKGTGATAKTGASALPQCKAGERVNRRTRICEAVAKAKP